MAKFPKRPQSARTAEAGVNAISAIVNDDLRWLFRRTPNEVDFGVDGYIDIVLEDGSVTGQSIAVQIKSGESYFRTEDQFGIAFFGEQKHLNYYANLAVPILILLHDPRSQETFWVRFNPHATEKSDSGWRMTVPRHNQFSSASRIELLEMVGPPLDIVEDLETHWALDALIVSSGYVYYMIDRQDIERGNAFDAVSFFDRLQLNPRTAHAVQGKVELGVWGYDDDDRELWEIEEVRDWFSLFLASCPFWLFFLSTKREAFSIRLLGAVSCSTARLATDHELQKVLVEYDTSKLSLLFQHGFAGLNEMTDRKLISEEDNKRISFEFMDIYGVPHEAS
jgi:hypothetical protein